MMKEKLCTKFIEVDMIKIKKNRIRHDSDKLANVLMKIIVQEKILHEKKNIFEYIYLEQKLRKKTRIGSRAISFSPKVKGEVCRNCDISKEEVS